MFRLAKQFLSSVIPRVLRPLRILWNELLGTIFLTFAIVLVRPTWKAWKNLDADPANLIRLLLSVFFLLLMAGFGAHAFWRARKLSRT